MHYTTRTCGCRSPHVVQGLQRSGQLMAGQHSGPTGKRSAGHNTFGFCRVCLQMIKNKCDRNRRAATSVALAVYWLNSVTYIQCEMVFGDFVTGEREYSNQENTKMYRVYVLFIYTCMFICSYISTRIHSCIYACKYAHIHLNMR